MSTGTDSKSIDLALRQSLETHPSFAYPWDGLEAFLDSRGESELVLLGYGSLISQQSASRTINVDSSAKRRPVRAFGAKRVFNYRMPVQLLEKRYGTPSTSKHVAALNCERSGSATDQFNGILSHVERASLEPLREREKQYSLKPVVYCDWGEEIGALSVAYVFELLPDASGERHPYDSEILPHVGYTRLCQAGAGAISGAFLDFFNQTSFLADKETKLVDYHLPGDPG